MRGVKAKRLRREAGPQPDLGPRPALYTHPISQGPGRKERRGILAEYRRYLRRAARYRDQAASKLGRGTPPLRVTASLKIAGSLYHESDPLSAWALVAPPRKKTWGAWKPE